MGNSTHRVLGVPQQHPYFRYAAVDLPQASSCLSKSHLLTYWKLSFLYIFGIGKISGVKNKQWQIGCYAWKKFTFNFTLNRMQSLVLLSVSVPYPYFDMGASCIVEFAHWIQNPLHKLWLSTSVHLLCKRQGTLQGHHTRSSRHISSLP